MKRIIMLAVAICITGQLNAQGTNNSAGGATPYQLYPYAKYDNVVINNSMFQNNSAQYNRGNDQNSATFPGNGTYYDPTRDVDFKNAYRTGNTVDMNMHTPRNNGSNANSYNNLNSMPIVNMPEQNK